MKIFYYAGVFFLSLASFSSFAMNHMEIDFPGLLQYCEPADDIENFQLSEFNNADVGEIRNLSMERGAYCKNDKDRFQILGTKIIKKIYSITTDETKRDSLFKYANAISKRAKWYTCDN